MTPASSPDLERLDGGQIKGTMLRAHLTWLERQAGMGARERLLSELDATTAELVRQPVLPSFWYPFRALIALDRGIARVVGLPAERVARELGRFSAEQNLTTFYKAFQRKDPHEFFRQEALLHDRFLDFGRAVYTPRGEGAGLIRLLDYPCCSPLFCLSATGYYQRAAELQGGRAVIVQELGCLCRGDPACEFDVRWQR